MARLLRGSSWEAITREIAWHALEARIADADLVESLSRLADERLSELVEGVEFQVDRAASQAWSEYVQRRPRDREGAKRIAMLEARHRAEHLVAVAYETTYLEIAAVVRARETARVRRRPRPFRHEGARAPIASLPALVLDDLARSERRQGGPASKSR
jgi:hypothetical protein